MSYLQFDKKQLVNLEYSVQRELLRSNRAGSYCCTTLSGCNTRKYHGLLICPVEHLDHEKHVLLSSFDETVVQHGSSFNLGIHKYDGDIYQPKGHKYISDFDINVIPKTTFRVGDVVLTKEMVLVETKQQVLIRYTLVDANSPTMLQFRPFLAFRNMHTLSKANLYANTKYKEVENGIKMRLYDGYPYLNMQFSKEPDFVPVPDWYYNIDYYEERQRGYESNEDLFVPGYFELAIKKGETIVFSASTDEIKAKGLKRQFTMELKKKTPRDSFFGCLRNSAEQFFVNDGKELDIIAGYPWYGGRSRQTFVALPGLTLCNDDVKTFEKVLKTQLKKLRGGMFPKMWGNGYQETDSVDAPLFYIWSLQQLYLYTGEGKKLWKKFGESVKDIIKAYLNGLDFGIKMADNGLIQCRCDEKALTWMDAYVDGKPVTIRRGMAVEVNALWYNAVCFAYELAKKNNDEEVLGLYEGLIEKIGTSFIDGFWSDDKGYLADVINSEEKNWQIRPNQVIACALRYSPLSKEQRKSILSLAKKELVTPRGLRSLSPRDPGYCGISTGDTTQREQVMHNGSVFAWLMMFFIEGYLDVHGKGGMAYVKRLMDGFDEEMTEHCVGTFSEIYDGNPPHKGRGAVSQAWNVGAVLRSYMIIEDFETKK